MWTWQCTVIGISIFGPGMSLCLTFHLNSCSFQSLSLGHRITLFGNEASTDANFFLHLYDLPGDSAGGFHHLLTQLEMLLSFAGRPALTLPYLHWVFDVLFGPRVSSVCGKGDQCELC